MTIELREGTDEFKAIKKEWEEEAGKMTLEDLPAFLKKLTEDYQHDYGTICHAIAIGAVAASYALNNTPQGNITGFQAGCIMWEFIRTWNHKDNVCGMKIINYDNMLFPQYEENFDKTITNYTWEKMKEEAANRLASRREFAHPNVVKHWESIVMGIVPFGYTVKY